MFREIIEGFGAYFGTMSFIRKHRLHGYFVISGVISILIGAAIFSTSYFLSDDLGAFLFQLFPNQLLDKDLAPASQMQKVQRQVKKCFS